MEQSNRTASDLSAGPLDSARAIHAQWRKLRSRSICTLLSLLLVFPPILLAAYLTDGRGLADFRGDDWQIFAAMAITVLAGFGIFFLCLRASIRAKAKYDQLLWALLGNGPDEKAP